jgi:hypothetical protein
VQTCGVIPLKTNGFSLAHASKCESQVKQAAEPVATSNIPALGTLRYV